ncbi:MAG: glycosyltransferase [Gemmataceae bacterium]|nr:glycosyltransferase [Gemmataceae bacterium]MCI0738370.1 glycosyltransferase [Gemmataceae bacterium]
MAFATVKNWMKAQAWLRPAMPFFKAVYRVPFRLKTFVKESPLMAPMRPLLAFLYFLPGNLWALPFFFVRVPVFLWHLRCLKRADPAACRSLSVAGQRPAPRRIVMLVINDLRVDPRVQREAKALAQNGFVVTILCPAWSWRAEDLQVHWGPNIHFRILPPSAGRFICHYPHLYGRAFLEAALAEDAWVYHAHDLDTALIALLAATRKGVACVCDFHEWYSQNVTFSPIFQRYRPHGWAKRRAYQAVERLALHKATEVITVCDSIAQDLARVYQSPRPVHVIRNIPEIEASQVPPAVRLREELHIQDGLKIFLYQGGVGPARNLEPIIKALALAPAAVLVIRGPGFENFQAGYERLAKKHGVRDRLYCLSPVPSARVVAEAKAADAGIWSLLANVGLNFKYSLPNKVFEYIAAGIPLLVADLPEVRRIVARYEIGLCFDPTDPGSIAEAMNQFASQPDLGEKFRRNIPNALRDLRADQEWNKLVSLYRQLESDAGNGKGAPPECAA